MLSQKSNANLQRDGQIRGKPQELQSDIHSFKSENKGKPAKLQCWENCENARTSCPDDEGPHFDGGDVKKKKGREEKEPKPLKKIVIKDRATYTLSSFPRGKVGASNKR